MMNEEIERDSVWRWLGITEHEYNQKIFVPAKAKCAKKGCKRRHTIDSTLCGIHYKEFSDWAKMIRATFEAKDTSKGRE